MLLPLMFNLKQAVWFAIMVPSWAGLAALLCRKIAYPELKAGIPRADQLIRLRLS